jgi:hypothetical protein
VIEGKIEEDVQIVKIEERKRDAIKRIERIEKNRP